jgi:hypothetical protein
VVSLAAATERSDNLAMRAAASSPLILGVVLLVSCGGGGAQSAGTDAAAGHGGTAGAGGVSATGAGGTGGGPACRTVSPCGGDPVGNWLATESCLTASEDLGSQCAGASADITFTFSGTLLFNADLTYSATSTGSGTTTYHYPSTCLLGGKTCAQWGQALMQVGMYSSVTCSSDSASVCNCQALTASTSTSETGTYATSGGTFTTTHDGTTSSGGYCVQGNLLYEMPSFGDGGVQSMGSTVFTRQ